MRMESGAPTAATAKSHGICTSFRPLFRGRIHQHTSCSCKRTQPARVPMTLELAALFLECDAKVAKVFRLRRPSYT